MLDPNMAAGLPTYICPKVSKAPVIDGRPDDDAWSRAPVGSLVIAETGDTPSRTTTFSMCWDDDCLYVLFESEDPEIWATLTEHDSAIYTEDVVEVFLDPDCDPATYIELEFSPKNVTFDASFDKNVGRSLGNDEALAWTCEGMRSAIAIDGDLDDQSTHRGWTAEIAIPFASLDRGTPKDGEVWRGNLYRIDYKPLPEEFQAWSPTMIRNFHTTARFGNIVFSTEAE